MTSPAYLTTAEVAALLGVCGSTITDLIRKGELVAGERGHHNGLRIERTSALACLKRRTAAAAAKVVVIRDHIPAPSAQTAGLIQQGLAMVLAHQPTDNAQLRVRQAKSA